MALDTTVAGASADAYISVAEADALAATRPGPAAAAWTPLAAGAKEKLIRQATADVDAYVRSTIPYSADQRLAFPRDRDYTGTDPKVPFIDRSVKEATFWQAAFLNENARILDDADSRRAHGMFSFNNDDGTSGTVAIDPALGRFSARMVIELRRLVGTGHASVRSVPIRSLAYTEPL